MKGAMPSGEMSGVSDADACPMCGQPWAVIIPAAEQWERLALAHPHLWAEGTPIGEHPHACENHDPNESDKPHSRIATRKRFMARVMRALATERLSDD